MIEQKPQTKCIPLKHECCYYCYYLVFLLVFCSLTLLSLFLSLSFSLSDRNVWVYHFRHLRCLLDGYHINISNTFIYIYNTNIEGWSSIWYFPSETKTKSVANTCMKCVVRTFNSLSKSIQMNWPSMPIIGIDIYSISFDIGVLVRRDNETKVRKILLYHSTNGHSF